VIVGEFADSEIDLSRKEFVLTEAKKRKSQM
jgi:hypothetical protein